MLKTRELVGIIEDALMEMDGCVSKPDKNGYVGRIETNTKINGHCIFLEYFENGEKDKYMITVERV